MMQSHDTYNRDFDAAISALDRWLDTLTDVAHVERESTQAYWRARLEPLEVNACPVELMVSRLQTFDIDFGADSAANQPVTNFGLFLPLLQALAAGKVVSRSWSAIATGCQLTREMVVHLHDGHDWSIRRLISAGTAATELTAIANDHAFLPYRRD